jgi:hypothetical protein
MTQAAPAPHLAFFTPFRDPDSPAATWYGINTMTVSDRQLRDAGADVLTKSVWDRLVELEDVLGFEEIDPEETRGGAVVAVVRQSGTATEAALNDGRPVVDVHRAFTSGAPAINVDGMLAGTVGADAFAAAFLASTGAPAEAARQALAAADKALRPVRWRNWGTEYGFFRAPEAVRAGMARTPKFAWQGFVTDWTRLRAWR